MGPTLQSLPRDILVLLPEYIHNIEDYSNLASTCRILRSCMSAATPPNILRLAAAQRNVFFRPSPLFLLMATAKELGNWARISDANEQELAAKCQEGNEGLLELALEHCGLTMERIRELYLSRFSIINPVVDVIDKCVGSQWYSTPNFWDGGVSDAYTIRSEPADTFFHLAIYGELFSPDLETILSQDAQARRLKADTRLEFVKYCIPDDACSLGLSTQWEDPRRNVKDIGPYVKSEEDGRFVDWPNNNNLALTWTIRSSRWKPFWKEIRSKAALDFQEDFDDGWHYVPDDNWEEDEGGLPDWRQRMWENVMLCQGLEGLGMMRPDLRQPWLERIRRWKAQISELDKEPALVTVASSATLDCPYLLGDLRSCASGYVAGT